MSRWLPVAAGLLLALGSPALASSQAEPQPEPDDRAAAVDPAGAAEAAIRAAAAVDQTPDDPSSHRQLAGALLRLGRVDEAIAEYETAVRLDPGSAGLRLALGDALTRREGPSEAAIARLREATEIDPGLSLAHLHLGEVLLRAGRPGDAVEPLRRAESLDPQSRFAHLGLARALARTGDIDGARAELAGLLEVNPGDGVAARELARLLASAGRTEEARSVLDAGLAVASEPAEREKLRLLRADLRLAGDDLAGAVVDYRDALAVLPEEPTAWFNLGTALARLGRFDEAAAALVEAARREPADAAVAEALAMARIEGRQFAEARAGLEESVAAGGADPRLRTLLARLLATCPEDAVRDPDRALELGRALLAEAPTPAHVETVTMALAELGRFEEAVALQTQLLAQSEAAGHTELADPIRRRLEAYQRGERIRRGWES